ncbi:MAG: DUF1223 domain-containing protein [Hyphomicrobiales bacterium]|nr:DUF1223 domain-containing protein [Hyphomicrobiales bacterium]
MLRCAPIAALVLAGAAAGPVLAADSGRPVVIELFESQGCSSCPPANANLIRFAERKDALALTFAVDYWDNLGWKDTFARPEFTARQWAYAKALRHSEVFTPQIVVNGRLDGTGLEDGEMAGLASRADRGASGPELTFEAGAVRIAAGSAPPQGADVWLALYQPGVVEAAVRRGENAGRTLPHVNVVRQIVRLGKWSGEAERLPLPAAAPELAQAVLVQAADAGPILAAASDGAR